MRGLEDELLDRIDDDHGAGQRNERNACLFHQRDHRHGGTRGGAADDDIHLVVIDQALGEAVGLVGIAAVVVMHELQRAAEDAALLVDLFHILLQRLQFRIAQEGSGTGDGQHRADLDRIGGESTECSHGQGSAGDQFFHHLLHAVCLLC
ncbi:hypothetical protein SDC9_180821 [bioreactor metagenome]|uniref:Uncharacterized protein n=1 Tax=bioreactor metagenome TaxID=1076179 RepID=A0A645H2T2_9ZZZZ